MTGRRCQSATRATGYVLLIAAVALLAVAAAAPARATTTAASLVYDLPVVVYDNAADLASTAVANEGRLSGLDTSVGVAPGHLIAFIRELDAPGGPATSYTPYGVRIDPITGRGPMAIDTAGFSGIKTSAGGVRNSRAFWGGWGDRYGGTLSSANRSLVDDGLSPVVDDVWVRSFPEHADYLGETLVHHHLDMGRHAIPLPYSTHNMRPGIGFWHNGILPD